MWRLVCGDVFKGYGVEVGVWGMGVEVGVWGVGVGMCLRGMGVEVGVWGCV